MSVSTMQPAQQIELLRALSNISESFHDGVALDVEETSANLHAELEMEYQVLYVLDIQHNNVVDEMTRAKLVDMQRKLDEIDEREDLSFACGADMLEAITGEEYSPGNLPGLRVVVADELDNFAYESFSAFEQRTGIKPTDERVFIA